VVALVTQACAVAGHPGPGAFSDASLQLGGVDGLGAARRITAVDLRTVQGKSAFDAVLRLRPEFLVATDRRFGLSPASARSVYENGLYVGGIDHLEFIPLQAGVSIRRLSAVEAKSIYGSYCRCDGGVISVRTTP